MDYNGLYIENAPSIELIRDYLMKHPGIVATAEEIYKYWSKKGWNTKKGVQVKTLAAAVNVVNGLIVSRIKKAGEKKKRANKERKERCIDKYIDLDSMVRRSLRMKYSTQLQDRRWLAFRTFVFEVRGKKCEVCGSCKNIQVHHPRYINGRNAWEYNCNEVVVLCGDCHKAVHHIILPDKDKQ